MSMIPEAILGTAILTWAIYACTRKSQPPCETVIGRIVRRSICRVAPSEYVPLFELHYQFGGQPYVTEITGTPCRQRRDAEILLEREAVGIPRPIFINPDNPTQVTAQLGWSLPTFVVTSAYAIAAMIGAIVLDLAKGRG